MVINNGIPNRAATAVGGPGAGITPSLIGQFGKNLIRDGAVGLFVGVGHRVKTPHQIAGIGIVSSHIATHTQLGTAITNNNFVLNHSRRAGNGVRLALINGDVAPNHSTRLGVQSFQSTVEDADKYLTFVHRQAAVHHVTAAFGRVFARNLWVINPNLFTRAGVEGIDHRPRAGNVHHTVHHDRRCFHASGLFHIVDPANTQLGQSVSVDLGQTRVAGFIVRTAISKPLLGLFCSVVQPRLTHLGHRPRCFGYRRRLATCTIGWCHHCGFFIATTH